MLTWIMLAYKFNAQQNYLNSRNRTLFFGLNTSSTRNYKIISFLYYLFFYVYLFNKNLKTLIKIYLFD